MNKNEIIDFLKENNAFKGDKLSSGITTLLRNKYPSIIEDMKRETGINDNNISRLIWHLINENEIPKCPVCGNELEFKNYGEGYKKACSTRCQNVLRGKGNLGKHLSQETKDKMKQAYIDKYGVDNPFKSKEIQDKIKKTNLERYGVERAAQNESIKAKMKNTNQERYGSDAPLQNDKIKKKFIETNQLRYGGNSSMSDKSVREKAKQTNLERYGVDSYFKSEEGIKRIQEIKKKNFYEKISQGIRIKEITPLFTLDDYIDSSTIYKFKCDKCGEEFYDDLSGGHTPLCPKCYPKNEAISEEESEVRKFISENYNGIIEHNNRKIIYPQELDIYLPDLKLAFEYDGLYWHSSEFKSPNYHLNKTLACEKEGIRLIHISSDEWHRKKEIVKSIILSNLGKVNSSIGARECSIVELSQKEAADFLNENHIQGSSVASVRLGLKYKEELVSVLTFSKSRFSKEYDWEITRFANKLNTRVNGGFSKLLKYFRSHYTGSIITYSDRSKFSGDVYRKAGFEEHTPTKPGYFYFSGDNRIDRIDAQKHKLVEKYPEYSSLKEEDIMRKLGYLKFYDCGNWKFTLNEAF